ncbi:MAG: ORF6N domain-containing protein [Candidatus Marinimicrobia bacterium]|nr:ORF6N domain-containing protein [Candidatus Neomarinimicrobiota bacterium]
MVEKRGLKRRQRIMGEKTNNKLPGRNNHVFVDVKTMIFSFRDKQVMVDRDIAAYFGIETKRLNEQVKRDKDRFPESFCFRLNIKEKNELVAKCDRFVNLKRSKCLAICIYRTRSGDAYGCDKESRAISASIYIMNAFVELRRFMMDKFINIGTIGKIGISSN